MLSLASLFEADMKRVIDLVEVIDALLSFGSNDPSRVRGRTSFINEARSLALRLRSTVNISFVAYDGAFLQACAQFEQAFRSVLERYIELCSVKCTQYHHLPKAIRDWYPVGCGHILSRLDEDRFSHLTSTAIVASLASSTRVLNYNLLGEAFSFNDRNYWAKEIEDILSLRLGVSKIWQKLSRENALQVALGTRGEAQTEQIARQRLDAILQRRNSVIHRGRAYYTASASEVKETALYFACLIKAAVTVLQAQILAI